MEPSENKYPFSKQCRRCRKSRNVCANPLCAQCIIECVPHEDTEQQKSLIKGFIDSSNYDAWCQQSISLFFALIPRCGVLKTEERNKTLFLGSESILSELPSFLLRDIAEQTYPKMNWNYTTKHPEVIISGEEVSVRKTEGIESMGGVICTDIPLRPFSTNYWIVEIRFSRRSPTLSDGFAIGITDKGKCNCARVKSSYLLVEDFGVQLPEDPPAISIGCYVNLFPRKPLCCFIQNNNKILDQYELPSGTPFYPFLELTYSYIHFRTIVCEPTPEIEHLIARRNKIHSL